MPLHVPRSAWCWCCCSIRSAKTWRFLLTWLRQLLVHVGAPLQAQAFGSDLQAHNLQMKLRGLSPNHTLILLNGKRRHGTANVSVAGGPYGGSAAPDVSFSSDCFGRRE